MDTLINHLIDPASAGVTDSNGVSLEQFHFYLPWLIFLAVCFLVVGYYRFEARKRLFGSHALNKALLDKFTFHLGILAMVGAFLLLFRLAGLQVFGWRLWRYGWALWALGFFGYWLFYVATRYRLHLAAHNHQRMLQSYMPKPKTKGKTARV